MSTHDSVPLDDLMRRHMDPEGMSIVLMYGSNDNLVFVAPQINERDCLPPDCYSVACLYRGGPFPYYEESVLDRADTRALLAGLVTEEGLVLLSDADGMRAPRTVTLL